MHTYININIKRKNFRKNRCLHAHMHNKNAFYVFNLEKKNAAKEKALQRDTHDQFFLFFTFYAHTLKEITALGKLH